MYNFQKIMNNTFEDMMYLCIKADITKGAKGRELRKHVAWLLREEY